jgi:hypothetical protein
MMITLTWAGVISDFSRDVERVSGFASLSGEPLPHHFLYLEVSSSKSFKPWLRVSMERAKGEQRSNSEVG